jgi:uncharacterized protein YjbI with pentapeptide repeats
VHLIPRVKRGILLFRGVTEVLEEDASDVLQIVIGAEEAGAPKPVDHYRMVLEQRLDRKKGHLLALRDGDLLPREGASGPVETSDTAEMQRLLAREGLVERHARRRAELELEKGREQLRRQGLDPDAHLPAALPPAEQPPDLDEIPALLERAEADAGRMREEAERQRAEAERHARRVCEEHGVDYDQAILDARRKAAGPPSFTAAAQLEHLRDVIELARNAGVELSEVEAQLADPGLTARLSAVEAQLRDAYTRFAHQLPAASSRGAGESATLREQLAADRDAGRSLRRRDLTGADLSGLDLRGLDLRDAFLEAADLSGSDLRGADLSGAVLARANLREANLEGAKLAGANLGMANLSRTRLTGGVDLAGAVLVKADLTGADCTGARMDRADLSEAIFKDTDFSRVIAPGLTFLSSDLSGLKLAGADMTKCNFIEAIVTGVDFSRATLVSAVLVAVKGDGAVFRDANLENLRVVNGCSFEKADFQGAVLDRATLRGTRLAGSDFTRARLDGADLSECDLRGARFYRAVARDSRFVKADLSGASMVSANLMHALLQRATLHGADFRGANLFRADLLRVRVDGATDMEGAELTEIRFVDARRVHGQG